MSEKSVKTAIPFEKGYKELRQKDLIEFRETISRELGFTSRPSFYFRLHGKIRLNNAERDKVEKIFNDFGVATEKIWGKSRKIQPTD